MTQIASEDYVNKRIYLHVDTVTGGFDPAVMQQEHRTRRRLNASGERSFYPMVAFTGYAPKGNGKFTPKLTLLRQSVRIVPYDTGAGNYNLDILNEIVDLADELSDRDVFDRQGLSAHVNIDATYSPVEIVQTGPGVIAQQVWEYKGNSNVNKEDDLLKARKAAENAFAVSS